MNTKRGIHIQRKTTYILDIPKDEYTGEQLIHVIDALLSQLKIPSLKYLVSKLRAGKRKAVSKGTHKTQPQKIDILEQKADQMIKYIGKRKVGLTEVLRRAGLSKSTLISYPGLMEVLKSRGVKVRVTGKVRRHLYFSRK